MACAQVNTLSRHPISPVLGALYQMQGIPPSPRRTPTTRSRGSGRLDRPYPGRLLLCVELWPTFLLSSGSEPGSLAIRVRGGGESEQRKCSSTRRAPRETLPGLRRTKTSTDAAAARHWLGQQANERNRGIRSRAPQRRCSATEDRRT